MGERDDLFSLTGTSEMSVTSRAFSDETARNSSKTVTGRAFSDIAVREEGCAVTGRAVLD